MVYPSKLSRESVVGAALSLIREQGADALGMRAVALRLGVRPASLYKHVIDLAGLQSLLAEHAASDLLAAIDVAIALPVSWKPLVKSKASAVAINNPRTIVSVSTRPILRERGSSAPSEISPNGHCSRALQLLCDGSFPGGAKTGLRPPWCTTAWVRVASSPRTKVGSSSGCTSM